MPLVAAAGGDALRAAEGHAGAGDACHYLRCGGAWLGVNSHPLLHDDALVQAD